MTTPIKRYDIRSLCGYVADKSDGGRFVTYDDHLAAVEAAVKAERERISKIANWTISS